MRQIARPTYCLDHAISVVAPAAIDTDALIAGSHPECIVHLPDLDHYGADARGVIEYERGEGSWSDLLSYLDEESDLSADERICALLFYSFLAHGERPSLLAEFDYIVGQARCAYFLVRGNAQAILLLSTCPDDCDCQPQTEGAVPAHHRAVEVIESQDRWRGSGRLLAQAAARHERTALVFDAMERSQRFYTDGWQLRSVGPGCWGHGRFILHP